MIRVLATLVVAAACGQGDPPRGKRAPAAPATGSDAAGSDAAGSDAVLPSIPKNLLDIDAVAELSRLPASELPACERLRAAIHALDNCHDRREQQPWALVTLVVLQSNLDDIKKAESCRAAMAEVRAKVPASCLSAVDR